MQGNSANRQLVQDLPESLRDRLMSLGRVRSFSDGQLIFSRGHSKPSFCIVETGSVRFLNVGRDGRRGGSGVLEAGDSFGEFTVFANSPRFYDFYSLGDSGIRIIGRDQFRALMKESFELCDAIIVLLSTRFLAALDSLADLHQLPLEIRLCKYLLREACSVGSDSRISMTQEAMAEDLSVSRVALAQALSKLRRAKIVETGYGQIRVLNSAALRATVEQGEQLSRIERNE